MNKMRFFFLLLPCLCQATLFAQQSSVSWTASSEANMRFIENKGQFDGRNKLPGSEILYAVDQGELQIFFTKQGVTYYFEKKFRNPNRRKGDVTKPKYIKKYKVVHFQWDGANPNVTLTGKEKVPDYYSYSFLTADKSSSYAINDIGGYKKLVYKNLYPNIDIEYEFHPETGIKYSVILHPGADAAQVKMKYAEGTNLTLNPVGNIIIPTLNGPVIEHKPVTFYANSGGSIPSKFIQQDHTISFQLGNYNHSKTVVIDPWVQTPDLASSNCVWECEKDAAGNVYIIGGDKPMRLRKYNSAGVLQWTHLTPWDTTAGDWLGTLATDFAGNSYVSNGASAGLQKVNTTGGLQWTYNPLLNDEEYWSIAFNCDQTKLVVGGTKLGLTPPASSNGVIFDINTNNGNILNRMFVTSTRSYVFRDTIFIGPIMIPVEFPSTDINEVRALTSSRNAKYYFLTLDTVGAINQNFNACSGVPLFKTNSTYSLGYKCENYRPLITNPSDSSKAGNSGICAIRANDKFVYTQNGRTVHKRPPSTGAILASATIPGGTDVYVGNAVHQVGNSGIDIDDCGNVYVGSSDRVIKYDADLQLITSVATPYRVYDVAVSYNGEVIVCGATGDVSIVNRTGYVQSINMSACAPFTLTCCDPTICPAGPFCTTDAPVNLTRVTAGGTWGGPGITNTSTGTFSPSVAGVGTHPITYTLPCGTDTLFITVNSCLPLTVCIEPDGQYSVSGGGGTYTWEQGVPFQNCTGCLLSICIPPICSGFPDTTWTTFGTSVTVIPPGTFPIRVRDSGVNQLVLNSAAGLPNCSTFVCSTMVVTPTAQTDVLCPGAQNGSATMSTSGGTAPYTYRWQPGNYVGASLTILSATTYTVTATDANGCTGTGTVTIGSPTAISLSTSKTDATCSSNDGTASVAATGGTPGYTYLWNNGALTPSIDSLAVGNYSVTVKDVNLCSATASVAITSIGGPAVTLNSQTNILCNGDNTGAINISVSGGSLPYLYAWSTGAATQNVSNLVAGPYSVTVTDSLGCPSLFNATITEPLALSVTGVVTDASCSIPTGSINQTVTGGVSPYVFQWSGGGALEDISGLQAGNYSVTVTDNNNCTDTASYTVNAPGNFSVTLVADSASCQGVADGSVVTTISGGSSPFFYSWSTGASTEDLTNVGSGVYIVTVTDDNICTVSATATVHAPTIMTFTASITRVLCEGGNEGGIKLNPAGGTAPYTALWSNGQAGLSLTDLAPGTYTATVIDANGCNKDTTISLEAASTYTTETSVTNASCNGAPSGSAQVTILNATTPPYTYLWNTGDTTAIVSNIVSNTYYVTVTDINDCLRMDTATVGADNGLIIVSTVIDASCPDKDDGSIAVTVSGGTEPYTYEWNTGADSPLLQNIPAQLYSLTVTDLNDCIGTDTMVVHVDSSGIADCDTLIIYDVFSPNGDGTNDVWVIDGLDISVYPDNELQIFNRWGNKVFEAKPYLNNWDGNSDDGEPLSSATYYYILKLHNASDDSYSGSVTLIR